MRFYSAASLTTIYRKCLKNLARLDQDDVAINRLKEAIQLRLAELKRLDQSQAA